MYKLSAAFLPYSCPPFTHAPVIWSEAELTDVETPAVL